MLMELVKKWGGWYVDWSKGTDNGTTYFYINAWACQNSDKIRYFPIERRCVSIQKLGTPVPSPKGNGPCNPKSLQPTCGNPISIGQVAKVQQETDYEDSSPFPMSITRTFNSGPFSGEAEEIGVFGRNWKSAYDRHLVLQTIPRPLQCYIRLDNYIQFCERIEAEGNVGNMLAYRSDGKIYSFTQVGNNWKSDPDVDDRLETRYAPDRSTILGWKYTDSRQNTEYYDTNGKIVSVFSRSGAYQIFTYTSRSANENLQAEKPVEIPLCLYPQSGSLLPSNLINCVTDNNGKQINFQYDDRGRIIKIIDPEGRQHSYAYDGESSGCKADAIDSRACNLSNLTSITHPDGKVKIYYYNEIRKINPGNWCYDVNNAAEGFGHLYGALTGIVDENNIRYASWSYSCSGLIIGSEHAGGNEKVSLSYGARSSDGSQTVAVTEYSGLQNNPVATVRNYHYKIVQGVAVNDWIDKRCNGCQGMLSRSYDDNGNVLSTTDWNGTITKFFYDVTNGLETSRIEVFGTPQERKISTEWDVKLRLPLRIAEPMNIRNYTYDKSGNILKKSVFSTDDVSGHLAFSSTSTGKLREWKYEYNSLGQIIRIVQPRKDVLIEELYDYDSSGNLVRFTNSLHQVTEYENYDKSGHVGKIVRPNGLVEEYSRNERGWIVAKKITDSENQETTNYEYDGVGLLIRINYPDNTFNIYTYDNARRLVKVVDGLGNSIEYTLDIRGNVVDEKVVDSTGSLNRKVSRSFDELNNLVQSIGANY